MISFVAGVTPPERLSGRHASFDACATSLKRGPPVRSVMPEKILVITLDDQPGTFASLVELLDREQVKVRAVGGAAMGDRARAVLLVDDPEKARGAIQGEGFEVEALTSVTFMAFPDAGEVGRLLRRVADAGVNVSAVVTTREGQIVAAVSDDEKAREALAGAAVVT